MRKDFREPLVAFVVHSWSTREKLYKFPQRVSAVAFLKGIFKVVRSTDLRDVKYICFNLMMSFLNFP